MDLTSPSHLKKVRAVPELGRGIRNCPKVQGAILELLRVWSWERRGSLELIANRAKRVKGMGRAFPSGE